MQEGVTSVFCFNGNIGRNDGQPTSPHPAHLLPVSQEWSRGAVKCENRKERQISIPSIFIPVQVVAILPKDSKILRAGCTWI